MKQIIFSFVVALFICSCGQSTFNAGINEKEIGIQYLSMSNNTPSSEPNKRDSLYRLYERHCYIGDSILLEYYKAKQ